MSKTLDLKKNGSMWLGTRRETIIFNAWFWKEESYHNILQNNATMQACISAFLLSK